MKLCFIITYELKLMCRDFDFMRFDVKFKNKCPGHIQCTSTVRPSRFVMGKRIFRFLGSNHEVSGSRPLVDRSRAQRSLIAGKIRERIQFHRQNQRSKAERTPIIHLVDCKILPTALTPICTFFQI